MSTHDVQAASRQFASLIKKAIITGLLLIAACQASAQGRFIKRSIRPAEPQLGGGFGQSLMAADMDGDGFADLVIAEVRSWAKGVQKAGRIWIYYGPIFEKASWFSAANPLPNEELGWSRGTIADVNEDGFDDLLIPSPFLDLGMDGSVQNVGRAHLFLGPDFQTDLIYKAQIRDDQQFGFGNTVFRDPSGEMKLVVGAPGLTGPTVPAGSTGAIYIFDLMSGETPEELFSPVTSTVVLANAFGSKLLVHDLNDDGVDDLIVSEPGAVPPGAVGRGILNVFDGMSEQWSAPILPPALSPILDGFGGYIHHVGDLDGDGIEDLFVSAISTDFGGLQAAGVPLILAGPDFTRIVHAFTPPLPVSFGKFGISATVADLDLDGAPDVIIGDNAQDITEDRAYAYFGPEYDAMQVLGSSQPTTGFGRALQAADWDGDGCQELAVSADWGDGSGVVYLYDPVTLSANRAELSLSSGGIVDFNLDFPDGQAGKTYRAVLGLSGESPGAILGYGSYIPLNLDALTAASIALANSALLPGFAGALDGHGNAQFAMILPPGVALPLAGQVLSVAAVLFDASGQFGPGSTGVHLQLTP